MVSDERLRTLLVELGVTLNIERYPGQHPTDGAHEFASKALLVIKAVEDRIVTRLGGYDGR